VWTSARLAARAYTTGEPDPTNNAIEAEPEPRIILSRMTPQGWVMGWADVWKGLYRYWALVADYFANPRLRGVVNYLCMDSTFLRVEPSGAVTLTNWRFVYPDDGSEVFGQ